MTLRMDTFKEKQYLDNLCAQGKLPWQVWKEKEIASGAKKKILKTNSLPRAEKVLVD